MLNENKLRILVVDDEVIILHSIRANLRGEYDVDIAKNPAEARRAMDNNSYAVVLMDITLGPKKEDNGFILGKELKEKYPDTAFIMMSGVVGNFRGAYAGFDDYIVKVFSEESLKRAIKNAIYVKSMPLSIRLRRDEMLKDIIQNKESISGVHRTIVDDPKRGKLEKIQGYLGQDGSGICLPWSAYQLMMHQGIFTVAVATTLGCVGNCEEICVDGRRPLERRLNWKEIVAQFLHGLDSLMAMGVFEMNQPAKPVMHATAMGEPLSNLENLLKAIVAILSIENLNAKAIITSICRQKELTALIDSLEPLGIDLSRLRLYCSLNSPFPVIRERLMRGTKGQDLTAIRELLLKFWKITGNIPTISMIVIPGLNDRPEDFRELAAKWGDVFEYKLQAFAPSPGFAPQPTATMDQLMMYKYRLHEVGITKVRVREIVGNLVNAGCGSCVSDEELAKKGARYF